MYLISCTKTRYLRTLLHYFCRHNFMLSSTSFDSTREKKNLIFTFLRLQIVPQWGARIWTVYDKIRNKDWVFSNPAHQPANIAVRKAWTSGGIEWNWSPGIIGHSAFSESATWVGVVNTARGKVSSLFVLCASCFLLYSSLFSHRP